MFPPLTFRSDYLHCTPDTPTHYVRRRNTKSYSSSQNRGGFYVNSPRGDSFATPSVTRPPSFRSESVSWGSHSSPRCRHGSRLGTTLGGGRLHFTSTSTRGPSFRLVPKRPSEEPRRKFSTRPNRKRRKKNEIVDMLGTRSSRETPVPSRIHVLVSQTTSPLP